MNLSTSFINTTQGITRLPNSNLTLIPVRVVDVIMDESHPEYDKYGQTKCIGAVKYQPIDKKIENSNIETLPIAFPSSATLRTIPLVNEIVLLTSAPDDIASNENSTSSTLYYISIISIWNHPHHNASPDGTTQSKVELGNKFKEQSDINPLQPFPGDVLVEGRQGQSIRLSGNLHYKNIYTDQTNEGKPFTLISNGQKNTTNGSEYIEEDVNEDASSIYLLSNHTVPLEQARDKTKAWKKAPTKADKYQGSQVVVNGGRLYFNSKEENILFSSREAFGVTSNTVNLDAKDYIALDAQKIYLGEKALNEEYEPVLLGESTEQFLSELLYNIKELAKDLVKAKTVDGKVIPNLILRGKLLEAGIKSLEAQINPGGKSQLKSRKVYTE